MEELKSFREQNHTTETILDKINWKYYDIGNMGSDIAIVFLHGTIGNEEIFWIQMESLMSTYRIISFDLPPIIGVDALSQGIYEILSKFNVKRIVLIGTSFGGYLAQFFSFKYKEMVQKLVLSNTFKTTHLYNQKYKRLLMLEKLIPTFLIKRFMRKGLLSLEHERTRDYLLSQLKHQLTKKTLMARLKSFITDVELNNAPIDQVLIIETIKDPLVPEQLQDELKKAYPEASVKTFGKEANHFPYLTMGDDYTRTLIDFLEN
ncbi:MAG: alpha/beta hydrolase [Candidatus Heimdallarchaeota archaeon]|nr:MAG: alpha/beta hydrolase [Candidatus Heimdallarchaeota archaeon]